MNNNYVAIWYSNYDISDMRMPANGMGLCLTKSNELLTLEQVIEFLGKRRSLENYMVYKVNGEALEFKPGVRMYTDFEQAWAPDFINK